MLRDLAPAGAAADWSAAGAGERPVSGLPQVADGTHRVSVTARGARQYMDPDPQWRQVPLGGGSLTVECTFTTRAS